MEAGAKQVEEVLDRPELVAVFAEFDERFDEAYSTKAIDA